MIIDRSWECLAHKWHIVGATGTRVVSVHSKVEFVDLGMTLWGVRELRFHKPDIYVYL